MCLNHLLTAFNTRQSLIKQLGKEVFAIGDCTCSFAPILLNCAPSWIACLQDIRVVYGVYNHILFNQGCRLADPKSRRSTFSYVQLRYWYFGRLIDRSISLYSATSRYCEWDWCRKSFETRTELISHLKKHCAEAKPVKRATLDNQGSPDHVT